MVFLVILVAIGVSVFLIARAAARPARSRSPLAPVGIVSAVGYEQAPILAAMHVTRTVGLGGYTFYVGTIDARPVVDVLGYEDDESAQQATDLLATHFKPRALVFSGTAGSQSPRVHVGDVVLSGFVVDKSNVHYQSRGYQSSDRGVQLHARAGTLIAGAVIGGYGHEIPTLRTARGFGYGPSGENHRLPYIGAYAGTRQLATLAQTPAQLGTTSMANATGRPHAKGFVVNRVMTGVMGQAQTFTEPLSWIAAQNFLYQSDVEENESSGFAFAAATAGIPWMMVRGVSDSPWFPNAYQGVEASERAARVAIRIATRLPATLNRAPVSFSDLSATANARRAGYLIANEAYFTVSRVSKVSYTDQSGASETLSGGALARMRSGYRLGAAAAKP